MSETVCSKGLIAVIASPDPRLALNCRDEGADEFREDFSDRMYDLKNGLSVNYEGTLAYVDVNAHKGYRVREDIYGLFIGVDEVMSRHDFIKLCAEHGVAVNEASVSPYNCIWYNGSDNPVNELTKSDFLRRIA